MTCSFCKQRESVGSRDYGDGRGLRPVCDACVLKRNAVKAEAQKPRPYTDPGDSQECHSRRDR